jgi:hypothetical protein
MVHHLAHKLLEQILNRGLPSRSKSAAANNGLFHISGQTASRSIEGKRRGDRERIGFEECGARDTNWASLSTAMPSL